MQGLGRADGGRVYGIEVLESMVYPGMFLES